MIEWAGFVVALVALSGWTATLVFLWKTELPRSTALKNLDQTNGYIDARIREVFGKFKPAQQDAPEMPRKSTTVLDDQEEALREARRRVDAMAANLYQQQPPMGDEVEG